MADGRLDELVDEVAAVCALAPGMVAAGLAGELGPAGRERVRSAVLGRWEFEVTGDVEVDAFALEALTGLVTQRVLADPVRGDGHDASGTPGDCQRAAVASLTGVPYDLVPHFAVFRDWYTAMRLWARSFGWDVGWAPVPEDWEPGWLRADDVPGGLVLASGPSPRGKFWHTVVAHADTLETAWDPHPSRAGLVGRPRDLQVVVPHWMWPPPYQLALPAA